MKIPVTTFTFLIFSLLTQARSQEPAQIIDLQRAADWGDKKAAYALYQKYEKGDGVPRDHGKADYWLSISGRGDKPKPHLEDGPAQASPSPTIAGKLEDIPLDASGLYNMYDRNEIRADELYKGRVWVVKGTVQTIARDLSGSPYVVIGGQRILGGIQCSFQQRSLSRLSSLSKGQEISVKGMVTGKLGNVHMSDCLIVE